MNSDNIRNITILIQSSTIFIALSTLLGRIYFLKYHQVLGVPVSEAYVSTTDYPIISPDVTVYALGLSVLFGFFMWTKNRTIFPPWILRHRAIVASVLYITSISALVIDAVFIEDSLPGPDMPGVFGLWFLFPFALVMVGMVLSGTEVEEISDDIKFVKSLAWHKIYIRIPIIIFFAAYLFLAPAAVGAVDARETINSAPEVTVDLKLPIQSGISETDDSLSNTCNTSLDSCNFKMITSDNHFIYLQLVGPEPPSGRHSLHAIPIDNVLRVTYLPGG